VPFDDGTGGLMTVFCPFPAITVGDESCEGCIVMSDFVGETEVGINESVFIILTMPVWSLARHSLGFLLASSDLNVSMIWFLCLKKPDGVGGEVDVGVGVITVDRETCGDSRCDDGKSAGAGTTVGMLSGIVFSMCFGAPNESVLEDFADFRTTFFLFASSRSCCRRNAICLAITTCLSAMSLHFGHSQDRYGHSRLWPFRRESLPWFRHLEHFGVLDGSCCPISPSSASDTMAMSDGDEHI